MRQYLEEYFYILGEARRHVPIILALILTSASLDLFGLSLIPLLVGSIMSLGTPSTQPVPSLFSGLLPAANDVRFLIALSGLVIAAFALKGVAAYKMQRAIIRFSELHRSSTMTRLMRAYLAKPYEFHLSRNSATLINAIVTLTWTYSNCVLAASIKLLADVVLFLAVVALLAITDWMAITILVAILSLVLLAYYRFIRVRLDELAPRAANVSARVLRAATEAIGSFKEVRLLGVEKWFVDELASNATEHGNLTAQITSLQVVPRYLIETALVLFFVFFALVEFIVRGGTSHLIPILAVFAIAGLRLMPTVTSLIVGVQNLRAGRFALSELVRDLRNIEEYVPPTSVGGRSSNLPIRFREAIFHEVDYTYPESREASLNNISFEVNAGEAVGIIGKSGAGKSTLADVLLGLLSPSRGTISINGEDIRGITRRWQAAIAYIPQSIFLTDDSLRRNIAFGVPEEMINDVKVQLALESAQLSEFVKSLPRGVETLVGENGVRLSGGQRQRVAIARALYHDRQVILMDEATAALDHETEREVVNAIGRLRGVQTLIIIAHRLSTLSSCDRVIRMEKGRIVEIGTYEEVVTRRVSH